MLLGVKFDEKADKFDGKTFNTFFGCYFNQIYQCNNVKINNNKPYK